jgi:dynein heavy chain 1
MSNSFCLTQLRIEGATCKSRTFSLVETAFTSHELTILRWVMREGDVDDSKSVSLPLYLNTTRSNLIVVVPFEAPSDAKPTTFYRRGVAMMCSSLSGVIA